MNTTIIPGTVTGSHIADGPLTTTAIREASSDLLTNEIDSRVVKIRPMSTPIDQISRLVGARRASSMIVDYYSVDTRPVEALLTREATMIEGIDPTAWPMTFMINTENDRLFAPTETLIMPEVTVTTDAGTSEALVICVREVI